MLFARIALVVTGVCSAFAASAEVVAVAVDDIRFRAANLAVIHADGESTYSQPQLEALGTYQMTTVTPWRDAPAEFVGVLLRDVLKANGLETAGAIRVTAENDFSVVIDQTVWADHDALIATRVDGAAHSRRARGPLQFVFSMSDDPRYGSPAFEANWVWMAARIEAVE